MQTCSYVSHYEGSVTFCKNRQRLHVKINYIHLKNNSNDIAYTQSIELSINRKFQLFLILQPQRAVNMKLAGATFQTEMCQ